MTLGATLVASFLATLARPATWILALLGFLVRGGIIVVIVPIVVLPSAVGVANVITPLVTTMAFTGISEPVIGLVVTAGLGFVAWLVFGGLTAAIAEAEGVAIVVEDDDLPDPGAGHPHPPTPMSVAPAPSRLTVARRILTARLLSAVPLVAALTVGAYRIVEVAYRELTVPSDVATPVVLRVARGAPEAIAIVVAAWILAEILGALAARRIIMAGDGVSMAMGGAVRRLVRHPVRCLAAFVAPLVLLIAVVVPSAAASSVAWAAVRAAIQTGPAPVVALAMVVVLVVLWAGGLVLVGMVAAWRAAVWTADAAGTFGVATGSRPGEWPPAVESANVGDPGPPGADPEPR